MAKRLLNHVAPKPRSACADQCVRLIAARLRLAKFERGVGRGGGVAQDCSVAVLGSLQCYLGLRRHMLKRSIFANAARDADMKLCHASPSSPAGPVRAEEAVRRSVLQPVCQTALGVLTTSLRLWEM